MANLERLQKKVEKNAKNFDDYERLRFIMLEKAKQKRSIIKTFIKLEQFNKEEQIFKEEEKENEESGE